MARLAKQAILISLSRIANQALMIISPVVLVRLMSVEDFGRYREFLLYVTLLTAFASFSIYPSLLYFVPSRPAATAATVRRSLQLVALSSVIVMVLAIAADAIMHQQLFHGLRWSLVAYVLMFVNFDFWEHLWLAEKKTGYVFAYTSGRLFARMAVVIVAAALTHDVDTVITALIVLEAVRFAGAALVWYLRVQKKAQPSEPHSWRAHLEYCVPLGISILVLTLNSQLGALVVDQSLGPVALAQYTIGGYVYLIVNTLRNSISDVLLPEMVSASRTLEGRAMDLWRRSTIIFAIMLLPIGVVLFRYADVVIATLFSKRYVEAVPVFQLYLLVLVRECFDLDLALKAVNKTAQATRAHIAMFLLNLALLLLLAPRFGVVGAAAAMVIARFVNGIYLSFKLAHLHDFPIRALLPWQELGKVALAAVVAASVLYPSAWTDEFGTFGAAMAAVVYGMVFILLLFALQVPGLYTFSNLILRKRGL
jgi:O-antigen/teichoic acid export membrane protein